MKIGDKLKIVEKPQHNEEETIEGVIIAIDNWKVTIEDHNKIKTSYNIADFKTHNKKFYLDDGTGYKRIQVKVKDNYKEVKSGGKYD